jgi:hypothetical protein
MAVTYSVSAKNYRLQLVADLIAGKMPAPSTGISGVGILVLGTSALAGGSTGIVVQIPLSNPPALVSSGQLILSGVPVTANAIASGLIEKAEIRDPSGNVVVSGLSVGVSGANINISPSVNVSVNQSVQITSGVITHG